MRLKSLVGVIIFAAVGCASTATNYSGPQSHNVVNEKSVGGEFGAVWSRYVDELSKSFFVINNISRDSGIINISYSTGSPGDFIDCGDTRHETKHPDLGSRVYNYRGADGSSYLYGVKDTNILLEITRRTKLTGRANVFIADRDDGTLVRANVKYVFTIHTTGKATTGEQTSFDFELDFSTSEGASYTIQTLNGPVTLRCVSNGRLETRLLDLAKSG